VGPAGDVQATERFGRPRDRAVAVTGAEGRLYVAGLTHGAPAPPGRNNPGIADLLVASFTDDQIASAVDAVHYEDPRASSYIRQMLIDRRDKVARYWFQRIAPLDFFYVENGALRFHDLAVDLGLSQERNYRIHAEPTDGQAQWLDASSRNPEVRLRDNGREGSTVSLELSIVGSRAKPARVELVRRGGDWVVARVRHG
jgi:hypothetical protein